MSNTRYPHENTPRSTHIWRQGASKSVYDFNNVFTTLIVENTTYGGKVHPNLFTTLIVENTFDTFNFSLTLLIFMVRGRRLRDWRHRCRSPSTPTHVGQTSCLDWIRRRPILNPHARGADYSAAFSSPTWSPQPPRTWGRLQRQGLLVCRYPSTPTHVGPTKPQQTGFVPCGLNPHARGADSMF